MSIDQHVNVTAVINNFGIARVGFGTIAVLSYTAPWTEKKRSYRSLAAAIADGFPADSCEAMQVERILGQSPHPIEVAILNGALPPTQRYTVETVAIRNTFAYKMKVKGRGVTATTATFTSSASATKAKVHNGMLTQLNTVVGKNYLAAFAALAFANFTVTADSTTDQVHAVAHGLLTGDGPIQFTNSGGGLPAGIAAVTDYWIVKIDADNFKLATSLANALAGTVVDITTNGTGVQTANHQAGTVSPTLPIVLTATSAGAWFSLEVVDITALATVQTHVDPGVADDLAAIVNVDKNWYYLVTNYNSEAMVLATAAAIEALPFKFYLARISDSEAETTAVNNGDLVDQLGLLGYKRTLPIYHRKPDQMIDGGLGGRLAPLDVGVWTAAYKSITGAVYDQFSDTHTDNLDDKRCSYYKLEADTSIMWEGKVGNTDYGFMDVTVSLDFVIDDIQKSAFSTMKALNKVSYTDADIALIRKSIEGAVDRAMSSTHKIVAPGTPGSETDPPPFVTFPRVADIDPGSRALRELPDGVVNFRLQGAVHSVRVNLTVSF